MQTLSYVQFLNGQLKRNVYLNFSSISHTILSIKCYDQRLFLEMKMFWNNFSTCPIITICLFIPFVLNSQ